MGLHHRILIVGGGNAGLSVAARLRHSGQDDIAVVEPNDMYYYQPLWTLVGGGRAPAKEPVRPQASVMPQGVAWINDVATATDPEAKTVTLASGLAVGYDFLVVCPGIQLDWNKLPGLPEALKTSSVSSNYSFELAPKTWNMIRALRSGTAVFTMPAGRIKCAGAPQKIACLAADYWREQGVLDDIRMVLMLPTPGMFGVKEFFDELDRVVADYGIEVRFSSEATSIDSGTKTVSVRNNTTEASEELGYDFLHAVPPQSAPDWLKNSALPDPDNPAGYVQIDKNTLRHTRDPEVFALGDVGPSPNSKTGGGHRQKGIRAGEEPVGGNE